MAGSSKVVDFYKLEVIPSIMASAPSILPEFDFKWAREGWVAGSGASQAVLDYFGVRHDRIALSKLRPGLFIIAGEKTSYQLHAWVLNKRTPPKGEDYTKAVLELANMAGVDASSVDGSKRLTAEDRDEINARRERLAKEAKEQELERNAQKKREDQEAVKDAMNFLVRAKKYTDEHGQKLALDYFAHRGHKLGQGGLGKLPASVLCIGNAGIGPAGTGAVVFPTIDEHGKPTGLQRVFVDSMGRPVTVEINGKQVGKATMGRPFGSRCTLGEGYKDGVCVVDEGGETGVAIIAATGYTVECGISSGGVEQINLSAADIKAGRIKVIVLAGDLDRSGTGQKTTAMGADRLRAMYGIPVVELLPDRAMMPDHVGDDGLPDDGLKSVDFDDVLRVAGIDRTQDVFDDAIKLATVDLQHAPKPPQEEDYTVGDRPPDDEHEQPSGSWRDQRPPRDVMPKNDLDRALLYIKDRHLPDGMKATALVFTAGRLYRWDDGVMIELGEPGVIRGDIRRWGRPYFIEKRDKWGDVIYPYPQADLSKSQIAAISDAVIDECAVVIHADDFRTQYWLTNNVDDDGVLDTKTASWARRIEDPNAGGLPEPELILSTRDGLLDLDAWREHEELTLLPHTPSFFTLSQIDISLPLDAANEALTHNDGLESLRRYAESLCPRWIKFLNDTFKDDEDDQAAPVTIRELHKTIGYYLTEDLTHHQGNITWFVGPAGVGKSVAKNVIAALLGKRNVVSSNMHKITQQFHLASWIGRRLAVFADLDQGARQDKTTNVEIFKMIATGDAMSVDRKHRDEIPSHVLTTRLLCLVNQMPHMPDPSNSLMRRSIVYDFKRIPRKEDLDSHLEEKMTTPESLAGIMLLAIVGLADLKADGGFIQPEWSSEPLEQLAEQSSDYPDFIEQCLTINNNSTITEGDFEGSFVSAEDLYDAFCGYLTGVGTKHHPKRHRMLSELVPVLTVAKWKKVKQGRVTLGGKASAKGYRGFELSPTGHAFAVQHRGNDGDEHGSSTKKDYKSPGFDQLPGV